MESFRKDPITEINDMKLAKTIDYLKDETDTPRSNVLKYFFDDNSWYAVRPSGTEPKLKIYIYTRDHKKNLAEKKIKDIEEKVMDKIESIK